MRISIWVEIGLILGFLTAVTLLLALPIGYVLCKMDRNPKDGPRCRKCGYDLRATFGETCVECGKKLSPRGVWPPGQPSRVKLVLMLALWSWLCASLTASGAIAFNRYQLEIVAEWFFYADLFVAENEDDGRLHIVGVSGNGWIFLDNDSSSVQAKQALIISGDGQGFATACVFDIESGLLTQPIQSSVEETLGFFNGTSLQNTSESAETHLKRAWEPYIQEQDQELFLQEVSALIELAMNLGRERQLSWDHELTASELDLIHSDEMQIKFGSIKTHDGKIDFNIEHAPQWVALVIPIAGIVIWLVGTLIVRRLVYNRQAIGNQSQMN